jgi:hypothetical protein
MQTYIDNLLLLLPVLVAIAALLQIKSMAKQIKRYRAKAQKVFWQIRYNLVDPKYGFDGRAAEILKVVEQFIGTENNLEGLALEMHVRNGYGEYFFVIARSTGTVFIKPITHASARAVLKDKYIPNSDAVD